MTTMEDLSKTQIILLTLLISFITSIATGIITVSLLAQAPQNVTQTIDRVVEQTVEQVAPTTPSAPGTVTKTTVVTEDDAIQSSIASVLPSIVRITAPVGADGTRDFYALGVIVSKSGLVISDADNVIASGIYTVALSDGSSLPASVVAVNTAGNMVLFKINPDPAHASGFTSATLSKNALNLGQTIIALEGKDKNAVAIGRVLSLDASAGQVQTDITPANEIAGGAILNLSGDLVGLKTLNPDLSMPASQYSDSASLTTFINSHASAQ